MKLILLNQPFAEYLSVILFVAGFGCVLFFLGHTFFRFRRGITENNDYPTKVPVTLIIPVLNEENELSGMVDRIFQLDDPSFEVILVDEGSEDDSPEMMKSLTEKYPRMKFSFVSPEVWFRDKMALNLGLKAATYDRIVILSSSTQFADSSWLTAVRRCLPDEDAVLVNYVNVSDRRSFFHELYRSEQMMNFVRSAVFSDSKAPFFSTQNNVCFLKKHYFGGKGFRGLMDHSYAAMELVWNREKFSSVHFSLDPSTFARENRQLGWSDYVELLCKKILLEKRFPLKQRFRFYYQQPGIVLLIAGTAGWIFCSLTIWPYLGGALFMLLIIYLLLLKKITNYLHERKIVLTSLIHTIIRPLFAGYCRVILVFRSHRK